MSRRARRTVSALALAAACATACFVLLFRTVARQREVVALLPSAVAEERSSGPLSEPGAAASPRLEARSVEKGPPASACTIVVESEEGARVEGLTLWSSSLLEQVRLGQTDAAGRLTTSLPALEYQTLRGAGESSSVLPRGIRAPVPPEIRLVAVPSSSITGYVVGPSETPIGAGIDVVVYEAAYSPAPELLAAKSSGGGTMHWAVTDAAGRFEVRGLRPRERYNLVAGGMGHSTSRPMLNVAPDAAELRVDLRPIYGAVLQATGPGGAPLALDDALSSSFGTLSFERSGVQYAIGAWHTAVLAGLDPRMLASNGIGERRFFLQGTDARTRVGPLVYSYALPGYRAAELEFEASRVDEGLSVHRLELQRDEVRFGSLALILRSERHCPAPEDPPRSDSVLELHTTIGAALRFRVDKVTGENRFQFVPVGRYMYRLSLHSGAFVAPEGAEARYVDIVEGHNELLIAIPDSGDLDLTVRTSSDVEHAGHASFTLGPASRVSVTADGALQIVGAIVRSFDAPPYTFYGLPAGDYVVFAGQPFPTFDGSYTEARIRPGERTSLVLEKPGPENGHSRR